MATIGTCILVSCSHLRIAAVASRPSISGICTSMSTRSKGSWVRAASASLPVLTTTTVWPRFSMSRVQACWAASKGQGVRDSVDLDEGSISLAVPPCINMLEHCWRVCDLVEQSSDVFSRTKVFDGHGQKFCSGVAIEVHGGVVDGKKREGIKIID